MSLTPRRSRTESERSTGWKPPVSIMHPSTAKREEDTIAKISGALRKQGWKLRRHALFGSCFVDLVAELLNKVILIEVKGGECLLDDVMEQATALRIVIDKSKGKPKTKAVLICQDASQKAREYAIESGVRIVTYADGDISKPDLWKRI